MLYGISSYGILSYGNGKLLELLLAVRHRGVQLPFGGSKDPTGVAIRGLSNANTSGYNNNINNLLLMVVITPLLLSLLLLLLLLSL